MTRMSVALACVMLGLAGCAPVSAGGNDGHGQAVPAARPIGQALSCIPITSIRESRVQDDWTIDFHTGGNQVYRMTLPQRCNGLGLYRAFRYETALNSLCNTDILTVMDFGGPGGGARGSCAMGMFQPVELGK